VATYHTFFEEYLHHYVPILPRSAGRMLARRVTTSQCAQVAALVAPSAPMRDLLLEYGVSTPIEVIPTGLPEDRYKHGDGNRFRAAHAVPHGRPLLLYVGRVAHEKNIDFLLHAFVEVRRSRPDALLVIAGEGPARGHLAKLVLQLGLARDVMFVGYLDREQGLADCYAAADAFVFASRTETQGLVLLEAMAQGCPVVSTSHLGTQSILQPGCGARVCPESAEPFARAVLDLLEDPLRSERATSLARLYARGWSAGIMAQRMLQLYQRVCGVRPSLSARGDVELAKIA
jgi:glycosyltransferase involved in cell wall biosynthesis